MAEALTGDPAKPAEVAYFRPGDMGAGHVRCRPKTGDVWFICNASGFWVIAVSPEVCAKPESRQ